MLFLGDEDAEEPSGPHRSISGPREGVGKMRRRPGFQLALLLGGCLAVGAPALGARSLGSQNNQNQKAQPPSTQAPAGNPFPEDENNVPVMPSRNAPDIPALDGAGLGVGAAPPVDSDPVRSPEEEMPAEEQGSGGFSSSQTGIANITIPPPEPSGRKEKNGRGADLSMPKETPKEDISVGNYYMDIKEWRGALSRFQSALVLDPENPDVYWGLAECQRHLGQFAAARENYLKVMEYDPDSRRAKQAKKALRDPELANAK